MEIWLVILFLSRNKFHAKQIFMLSSSMKLGLDPSGLEKQNLIARAQIWVKNPKDCRTCSLECSPNRNVINKTRIKVGVWARPKLWPGGNVMQNAGLSLGDITILSNIAILIWKRFRYRMDLVLIEISIYRDISRYIAIIAIYRNID